MRKKSVSHFFDETLWFIIYTLPIWLYIIQLCVIKDSYFESYDLLTVLQDIGFNSSNPIYLTFVNVFTLTGSDEQMLFPLFDGYSAVVIYASYFCSCVILHLMVDLLLFFPRLLHNTVFKAVKE